jgi:hypothetical protein
VTSEFIERLPIKPRCVAGFVTHKNKSLSIREKLRAYVIEPIALELPHFADTCGIKNQW